MEGISMTEQELRSLREELGELETTARAEMAARIKTARGFGDLKENAEYHAAKEAQAHLETRILRLREQLRAAVVVEGGTASGTGEIRHGSTIKMTDLGSGRTREVKIVSPNDAQPAQGMLSATSPVAQALIGHRTEEVVRVETPGGLRELRIDSVA
jgi:transcription elongation factor GreA